MDTLFNIGFDNSQVVRSFFETGQTGKKAGDDIENAFKRAGRETSNFTRFVREQRQENRMQNFVFRESIQSINAISAGMLALGNSMGGTNSEAKRLTQSITQGFLAFQGLEFALSALGAGPWGLAAAGVAGLTMAFTSFASAGDEASKKMNQTLNDVTELEHKLGIIDEGEYLTRLQKGYDEAKKAYDAYHGQRKRDNEEDARLNFIQLQALDKLNQAWKDLGKTIKDANKHNIKDIIREAQDEVSRNWDELQNKIAILRASLRKPQEDTFTFQGQPDAFKNNRKALQAIQEEFKKTGKTADFVANSIANSMQTTASLMTDAFFGATISIGDMFRNLFADIVREAFETFLKAGLLNILSGGAGNIISAASAGWDKLGIGSSAAIAPPSGRSVTVNVNLNGAQRISVAERTTIVRQIQEAVRKEKV